MFQAHKQQLQLHAKLSILTHRQLEYPNRDEVGSILYNSQPRRWLRVDKHGDLRYETVRQPAAPVLVCLRQCTEMRHSLPDLFHNDSNGLVTRLSQKHVRWSVE